MSDSRIPSRDHELLPVEELEGVHGPRTATTAGERLMVALAVVALLGGLLIAVGNVLPDPPPVGEASPAPSQAVAATPKPTRTPRPSPTPRPLREIALQSVAPPDAPPTEEFYVSTLVRALVDVEVRSRPASDAPVSYVLAAGDVGLGDRNSAVASEWLELREPQHGFVQTHVDGDAVLEEGVSSQYGPSYGGGGEVYQLLAGGDSLLAFGWEERPAGIGTPFLAQSFDGRTWRRPDQAWDPYGYGNVAWGPAGWLIAGSTPDGVGVHFWQSADGAEWEWLGQLESAPRDGPLLSAPGQLVGSQLGYLLNTQDRSGLAGTYWYSVDGRSWLETTDSGLNADGWPALAATDRGFYTWRSYDSGGLESPGAFLAGGREWRPVEDGPSGVTTKVVALDGGLLGFDVDPETRRTRVWLGEVVRTQLTWLRDREAEGLIDGVAVSIVDGRDGQVMVVGWDRTTEAVSGWLTDGRTWTELELPSGFGGIPRLGAMGPNGPVLVEAQTTEVGAWPMVWAMDDGRWTSELRALIPRVSTASGDCPPPADDVFEFMVADPQLAVTCWGDTEITFRAWSAECDGCGPGGFGMGWSPRWLMEPQHQHTLYLMPFASNSGEWHQVVARPEVSISGELRGRWIQVTGRFDDPTARECQWEPTPEEEAYYIGREAVIEQCRRTFVATDVQPVEGP
jgi:hypothetical protein